LKLGLNKFGQSSAGSAQRRVHETISTFAS
jgi:hypothetical protein